MDDTQLELSSNISGVDSVFPSASLLVDDELQQHIVATSSNLAGAGASPHSFTSNERKRKHRLGEQARRERVRVAFAELAELLDFESDTNLEGLAMAAVAKIRSLQLQIRTASQTYVGDSQMAPEQTAMEAGANSSNVLQSPLPNGTLPVFHMPSAMSSTQIPAAISPPAHPLQDLSVHRLFEQHTRCSIIVYNAGAVLDANESFSTEIGFSQAELRGMPLARITPNFKTTLCKLMMIRMSNHKRSDEYQDLGPTINSFVTADGGCIFQFGKHISVWDGPCLGTQAAARPASMSNHHEAPSNHATQIGIVPFCPLCGVRVRFFCFIAFPTRCEDLLRNYLPVSLRSLIRVFDPDARNYEVNEKNFLTNGLVVYTPRSSHTGNFSPVETDSNSSEAKLNTPRSSEYRMVKTMPAPLVHACNMLARLVALAAESFAEPPRIGSSLLAGETSQWISEQIRPIEAARIPSIWPTTRQDVPNASQIVLDTV